MPLASGYNPHINYAIFREILGKTGAKPLYYHPKLSPPIYLALKKLEVEGLLRRAW